MRRRMLKSKIHRATVTAADLHYEGSISLDPQLMARADIRPWEQVAVLDIDNGARFETYAIEGDPGEVKVNGAAAHLVEPGHLVIVLTYADYDEAELDGLVPTIVHAAGLRGPNAVDGLRGPNAVDGLRGPNAMDGLHGPNAMVVGDRADARA